MIIYAVNSQTRSYYYETIWNSNRCDENAENELSSEKIKKKKKFLVDGGLYHFRREMFLRTLNFSSYSASSNVFNKNCKMLCAHIYEIWWCCVINHRQTTKYGERNILCNPLIKSTTKMLYCAIAVKSMTAAIDYSLHSTIYVLFKLYGLILIALKLNVNNDLKQK